MTPLYANTSGESNTAVGASALSVNSTGNHNTAVGSYALSSSSSGQSNIAIGYRAGSNVTTGSDNIHIGHEGVAGDSGKIRIGDGSQTETFIDGIRGNTTGLAGITVLVDTNGELGTVSSSRRFRKTSRRSVRWASGSSSYDR